ncbi:hypothetical protein DERP_005831 [Dermatophagoides pteronyssinus]|uniref:Vitellogenin-like n=1 Tax=Dermatophagoides pteronyssinus TaxID=6956 RepID=A0ABQ8JAB4_DERPT|nr:hypothetical protein DERP_005831 [Dermatophagoides pteronyssinus]
MKTLLGLLFTSALLISAVWSSISPIRLTPGQSYIYSYNGRLISGIAQFDSDAALMEIKSDIVLQAEQQGSHIAMQMTNIRIGKHNGPVSENLFGNVVVDHQPQKEYEEQLSKPIRFYWDNGQIKAFEADGNEQEWSINIKKSILSLFNVNLAPKRVVTGQQSVQKINNIFGNQQQQQSRTSDGKLVVYPVYEDGTNGVCETVYQVISAKDKWATANTERNEESTEVFNVTKTRNYDNCLTRPSLESTNTDYRGAPVICHEGKSYPLIDGYYPSLSEEHQLGGCQQQHQDPTSQDGSAVSLYNFVKYNISSTKRTTQIDSAYGQGKTVYETKGKQLVIISEQNVTLMDVIPTAKLGAIRQIRSILLHQELSYRIPETETQLDIPYYHLFGQIDKQELKELIPSLLASVSSDIETTLNEPSKNTMQKVVQLANAMAVLDTEHFEELFERVAKQGRSHRATAHEQMNRKLFLDLLCYAGTTDAALFIKKLYEQDRITTSEAKEMIESVPQNLFLVDAKVVEEYLNMFLSEKVQKQRHLASSTGIALGKMINQATVKRQQMRGDIHDEQSIRRQQHAQAELKRNTIRVRRSAPWHQHFRHDLLEQNEVSQVMQVLAKALKTCTTFHQKVTLIETLAHTGTAEALAILAPYVQDNVSNEDMPGYPVENENEISQERNFVRQVCIYALTHIASANTPQVRALMLPIFQNKNEPYEVRIAAFTVLLGCNPGKYVLERISTEMHHENNRQVKSFVISSLKTIANFTEPSTRQLAEDARFALGFAPKDEYGIYYSKMIGQSYYDESKKYGMNIMAEWVSNNVSKFPRSGYLAVRETDGPTQEIPIELGYNVKGLDSIIERLTSSNGLINDVLQSFNSYGKDRRLMKRKAGSAQETMRTLKEKLDLTVRTEEEPKATIFFKLFEQTSYYAFDRQYVQQLLDSAEDSIKDIISQLSQGQQYHYIKLVLPKQMYKVVSSEIGLPIVITQRYPTVVSVKINGAKVEFVKRQQSEQEQDRSSSSSSDSRSSYPQGVNFTAQIEPSIHHSSYHFIFALTPITTEAIGAHISRESRVAIPMDLSVNYLSSTRQLSWSITPRVPQEVYHHQTQVKTFIAKAIIAGSPEREWLSETSSVIRTQPIPFKYEKQYGKRELGIGFNVKVTTESAKRFSQPLFKSETTEKYGYLAGLIELWNNDEMTPCAVHLLLDADEQNPVTGMEMAIRYKKLHLAENFDSEETTDETSDDDEYQENIIRNRQQQMWDQNEKISKWSSLKDLKQSIKNIVQKWNKVQSNSERSVSDKTDIEAHCIEVKARTQSAEASKVAVKFLLAHTYDLKHYWTNVRAHVKSLETESETRESQKNLCFDSHVAFPKQPSEFYYEPIANQEMKASIKAQVDFGHNCQTGSHVKISGHMETGEEKVILERDLESTQDTLAPVQKDWFYQQCQMDRADGKTASFACQRALVEDSYFKQLKLDIEYDGISDEVYNLTHKLATAAKVAFYSHLDENRMAENEEGKMKVTVQYSTRFANAPMVNVEVKTPKQNVCFNKVNTPYFRPISALYSTVQVYKNLLTAYESTGRCSMMEDYIRTFDNVSVELPDSTCQYLLAKDCSSFERFSILARQLDTEAKTKEVTIYVDGKEIVLTPPTSENSVQIRVDGQVKEMKASDALVMSDKKMVIYVRETSSSASSPMVVLEHEQHDFAVLYDGKNVEVKVGQQYKGETCGICGDNNHESENEFTGPDTCQYKDSEDFINSYGMAGQHCQRSPKTKGAKICAKKEATINKYVSPKYRSLAQMIGEYKAQQSTNRMNQIERRAQQEEMARTQQRLLEQALARQQQQQKNAATKKESESIEDEIQLYRTISIRQGDRYCFSMQPVLACIEGRSRPTEMRPQLLQFHCLPIHSVSAQRLVKQSQYRVLEIFGKKPAELALTLQVPVACQKA